MTEQQMKTKKPTKKQIKEAYQLIQSLRGQRSVNSGMSMSERGKLGAKSRKEKKALLDLTT